MTDHRTPTDERDELAAELALGALEGAELREARMREASDPEFAAEVARWRGRLAPMLDSVDPVDPPAQLRSTITGRIGQGPAANDNLELLERRVARWRTASLFTTAVAASLALVVVMGPGQRSSVGPARTQSSAPAPLVAMIASQNTTKVVASWDPGARQLVLAVAGDMPASPQRSHELWIIPAGGKPQSLGTMPDAKQMHMKLADTIARLLQQGATIAISVEPQGGSPTGKPTGPVVASGALTQA